MKLNEIILNNKKIYNKLAEQYNRKCYMNLSHQKNVLSVFVGILKEKFNSPKVIDVGCGTGIDSYILSKEGIDVIGVDNCSNMINYARINIPKVKFINEDFLKIKNKKFHGILLDAVFHLFPKEHVPYVIKKIKDFMFESSIGCICTTLHDKSSEKIVEKKDYEGGFKRLRKFYTEKELIDTLTNEGLHILFITKDTNLNKKWINIIFTK